MIRPPSKHVSNACVKFAGPLAQGRVGSSVRGVGVLRPIAMTIRVLPGSIWPRTLPGQSQSGEIENNRNIEQVISNFKPPIFWKEKEIVKKQAQSWSTSEIKEIIFKINDLEALVKKNTVNSMLFVSNFISNY